MYMRLGFAVAIHVDPDVLLVDEVLAVGDEGFTHKCLDKFGEFRRRGKTILLVTHSLGLVERFCDEALWIDDGVGRSHGRPAACRRRLHDATSKKPKSRRWLQRTSARSAARGLASRRAAPQVADPVAASEAPDDMFRAQRGALGLARDRDHGGHLLDRRQQPSHVFQSGDPMTVQLSLSASTADGGLRLRHRDLQRGRRLLLRHQHLGRGAGRTAFRRAAARCGS